jgi:acetylornithine/N-succinyldiaminopimelate aminotransferase
MVDNASLAARAQQVFLPNYAPAPLVVARGEGVWLFDVEGRRYLDLAGGVAVSALGHQHPRLVEAIRAQAGRVLHTSNLYYNQPSIELAEKILGSCFADVIFFCNSGAEANEAALKLARRHAYLRGERERTEIVTFLHSFHGRTFGALAATGQPKYHEGFAPLPAGFVHLPYGDVEALERHVTARTAAILVEPVQGEGGVRVPPPGFLEACRRIADRAGALLMFDEVQAGFGRMGVLHAYEATDVVPDVITWAKGIASGVPLGAMATTRSIGQALGAGSHGTTYGGNPLACAAGCVVMDELAAPGFLDRVVDTGAHLAAGLERLAARSGAIAEVRGRGLLLGAQLRPGLPFAAKDVVAGCRARGVLVHVAGPDVVRLAPPLILERAEADQGLAVLEEVLLSLRG